MENNTLERIEHKLDTILELLKDEVNPQCKKMSNHIDFITDVYSTVKKPLFFICDNVKRLSLFKQLPKNKQYSLIQNSDKSV